MENNIKNTEKKRRRFNAFDLLILVIALAVAFAAFWIIDPLYLFSADEKQPVTLTYVVVFRGVDDDVKNGMKNGDTVASGSTSEVLGKVTGIRTREAVVWEHIEGNDTMVKKTLEGKSDVYVTVKVDCQYEKGIGYIVNGQQIAYGTRLSLRLSGFVGVGECVSLSVDK